MKIKPYEETHMDGVISVENMPEELYHNKYLNMTGDFGIQIAEDGRVWICLNGVSFLRFTPSNKYHTVGSKLNPKGGKE